MSGNTERLGVQPPRLYSLQDLQRAGHNPPDGLYTLNQLGCILLYLKKVTGDDGLCDECLCMGTGKKPCPHGNFGQDPRLAPILVWPQDQSLGGSTRYAASNDDFEYWVTFNKSPRCDPATRPLSSDTPLRSGVDDPKDSMSHGAMPGSQAFELENGGSTRSASVTAAGSTTDQIRTPSPAAALSVLASPSPFCTQPLDTFYTTITALSPLPPSSPARPDTMHAARTTWLPQAWTERSTYDSYNLMHLATNSPGSETMGLRSATLGGPSYFHPYLPCGTHQSLVVASRTASVFNNWTAGLASNGSVPNQYGEFTLAPEVSYEHAKDAVVEMQV